MALERLLYCTHWLVCVRRRPGAVSYTHLDVYKRQGSGRPDRTSTQGTAKSMTLRRVAITGLGIVSPLGNDLQVFFAALMAGKSGIARLQADFTEQLDLSLIHI